MVTVIVLMVTILNTAFKSDVRLDVRLSILMRSAFARQGGSQMNTVQYQVSVIGTLLTITCGSVVAFANLCWL